MSTHPRLAPQDFERLVQLNSMPFLQGQGEPRVRARRELLSACCAELGQAGQGGQVLMERLPKLIHGAFQTFGWAWNGYYVLGGDARLHLGHAHGPPVCTPLEASGGALTSGMCFDSLALNQTLAAYDTKAWPGYVSCDASSQLGTVAGIVVPLRGSDCVPMGCWDLDSIQPIEPGDVRFMDVLFSTLARCHDLSPGGLGLTR